MDLSLEEWTGLTEACELALEGAGSRRAYSYAGVVIGTTHNALVFVELQRTAQRRRAVWIAACEKMAVGAIGFPMANQMAFRPASRR